MRHRWGCAVLGEAGGGQEGGGDEGRGEAEEVEGDEEEFVERAGCEEDRLMSFASGQRLRQLLVGKEEGMRASIPY